jgi:hypothetical protein
MEPLVCDEDQSTAGLQQYDLLGKGLIPAHPTMSAYAKSTVPFQELAKLPVAGNRLSHRTGGHSAVS